MDELFRSAVQLPSTELSELVLSLQGLLEAKGEQTMVAGQPQGSIELKMINGCGPYAYLRYYKGKRNGRGQYGSKYLGKWPAKTAN
ncbi:hypothetical protein [Synechococcus elongatus]|uniref:hypothetical protein n=1 Tax=Synechococcus elongatus TaxID=32046 RepID=UPI000F7D84B2|nr:hypothetical protein [Synechococcus elongatus]